MESNPLYTHTYLKARPTYCRSERPTFGRLSERCVRGVLPPRNITPGVPGVYGLVGPPLKRVKIHLRKTALGEPMRRPLG